MVNRGPNVCTYKPRSFPLVTLLVYVSAKAKAVRTIMGGTRDKASRKSIYSSWTLYAHEIKSNNKYITGACGNVPKESNPLVPPSLYTYVRLKTITDYVNGRSSWKGPKDTDLFVPHFVPTWDLEQLQTTPKEGVRGKGRNTLTYSSLFLYLLGTESNNNLREEEELVEKHQKHLPIPHAFYT